MPLVRDQLETAIRKPRMCALAGVNLSPWDVVFEKIGNRNIEYIRSLEKVNKTLSSDPLINLSTIHMAKGGECDNVMLFTDLSRANREEMEVNPDDTHRVFYVGVTRAKEQLHIIEPQNYGGFKI